MSDSETENSGETTPRVKKNGFNKGPMELYVVRISPACRMVWLYLQQNEIPHLIFDVDFSRGVEHLPVVFKRQPHQEVPLLLDGDVVIFEGQAILRYLSLKYSGHVGFGVTLQQQMTSESIISWALGELHRSVGFNYIYPQFLENYMLTPDSANEALVENGLRQVTKQLEIIEKKYFKGANRFLVGNSLTMADTAVTTVLVLLEWTGFNFKMWPKVSAWLARVKRQHYWDSVHNTHYDFVRQLQGSHLMLD